MTLTERVLHRYDDEGCQKGIQLARVTGLEIIELEIADVELAHVNSKAVTHTYTWVH